MSDVPSVSANAAPEPADSPSRSISFLHIVRHFKSCKDPRSYINLVHPIENVIAMAVMAILAGANGPTAIAKWANVQKAWLSQFLTLPEGRTPSKDVFLNVLSLLHPNTFQSYFCEWIQSLKLQAMEKLEIEKPILNVDGKTLRRSHDKKKGLKALHAVTIWASELGLTLVQVACHEKSNEITAIPQALALVDLRGTIITIDAMGCQKTIAKQIVDAGGEYVLALKGNQETLHKQAIEFIDEQLANDFAGCDAQQICITEKLHGEKETRIYTQFPLPEDFPLLKDWTGLKSIGTAVRFYKVNGYETSDVRHFICALDVDVEEFARATRGHWGIENGCHYTLDMTFREDYSRLREEKARQNHAFLNRLTLSLLKQHPGNNSISMKRQMCGWDPNFLLEVLTGTTT